MASEIDAGTVKAWLSDGREIAFLDVREAGQFGEGHAFFATPLPYSRLELDLPAMVPRPSARAVLCDGGDGVAALAARRMTAMGYSAVHVLAGGAPGWAAAGFTLFKGVNVPSKTFGEIVEHERHTPRITAAELQRLRQSGANIVIVDGRPLSEYGRMSIPGGICCPNGELALRIGDIAPDPATTIVVNCAGRTRSIIGAQTLIDLGVKNRVVALENGTQGWFLAGLELERGAGRRYPASIGPADTERRAAAARKVANARGVRFVVPSEVRAWLSDAQRTTYLLDVRTPEEFAAGSALDFVHAPGGQLIQATDQWVAVKGARIVLADTEGVRAPVVAAWLRQLGHDACVLEGGLAAAASSGLRRPAPLPAPRLPSPQEITPAALASSLAGQHVGLVDLRSSMSFRKAHIPGAVWSVRPRLSAFARQGHQPLVLVADSPEVARLAAVDLVESGASDIRLLSGGFDAWQREGRPVVASPSVPADADCIDYLFFVHDRHDGNAEAARGYIAWETGLLAQLDAQERGVFRVAGGPP